MLLLLGCKVSYKSTTLYKRLQCTSTLKIIHINKRYAAPNVYFHGLTYYQSGWQVLREVLHNILAVAKRRTDSFALECNPLILPSGSMIKLPIVTPKLLFLLSDE